MKRTIIGLLTASALTAAIPAVASAQTINERQNSLFNRIESGVRSGDLTQGEATMLRNEFYALVRLEGDYRASRPGLTDAERNDLNRRFDALSARIRMDRADNDQYRNWRPINQRQQNLMRQIDQAYRTGRISYAESNRLEAELHAVMRLENQYSRNGLTNAERAELDRRMDILAREIRQERREARRDGDWNGNRGNNWGANITGRIASLTNSVERAIRSGWVRGRDAQVLRAESNELRTIESRYRSGGFTNAERADLDRRADRLEVILERESGRDFGYGYGEQYGYYR